MKNGIELEIVSSAISYATDEEPETLRCHLDSDIISRA